MKVLPSKVLKYLRLIHRYVSFFCTGVLALYVISGFLLNHQREFKFLRQKQEYTQEVTASVPSDLKAVSELDAKMILLSLDLDSASYKKHKVKGDKLEITGSNQLKVSLDSRTHQAEVSRIYRPPFVTALNKLHRNPDKIWTWFSDFSLLLFVVLIVTGLLIVPGKKGISGVGGLLVVLGVLIPIIIFFLIN